MLTPRQAEIGRLVARGMSSKRIARETGLSVQTVNDHIMDAANRLPGEGRARYKILVFFLSIREDSAA
jgi:DNA-binding CsgD family transcriptional regulator